MTSKTDTRWVQRFEKYRKAFEVYGHDTKCTL